jgi:hypothetical protein
MWPDEVDDVLRGDLTCALAYVTPAGGAVATAVAPIGLRNSDAGTVGFTTSLGFGRKLERIKQEPRVALAYHTRDHGIGDGANRRYVLVQGKAEFDATPDRDVVEDIGNRARPYMGDPRRGLFWDRWLSAYYADRVLVSVDVERVIVWRELDAGGESEVYGAPLPASEVERQAPPKKGTEPRVDAGRAGKRAAALPHRLLTYVKADGYPAIVPVSIERHGAEGIALGAAAALPPGGRRAGLLAHAYRPKLIGLEARQYTGWLEVGDGGEARYAPHTEAGFKAPGNKTILLLANGFMARRGLSQARKQGRVEALGGPSG